MKQFLESRNAKLLSAYAELPSLLKEHYGIEQTVLAGGYGYRQVMELIQNGADAILEAHEGNAALTIHDRIHVVIRGRHLYVANTGAPLSEDGLDALLSSHTSPKRGNQIGRFGLGFKSLLRLGGKIDIFTKESGAIRFDPRRCREELKRRFRVDETPALRLAWPLADKDTSDDEHLSRLSWAETIVRVDVQGVDILDHLQNEIRAFPAEFLLFFPVPLILAFDDGQGALREIRIQKDGELQSLTDGPVTSRWSVTSRHVAISDRRALADATHIHSRDVVPVAWAVPLEGIREDAGRFWAFFPTQTPTYLPGIVNAPWKLNSDRNAIIGGEWNAALMQETAALIASALPTLASPEDPGRALEAFPRRLDRKDEDAASLVEALWSRLETAAAIPDARGTLRAASELLQHPRENPRLVREWQALAAPEELARFVHPSCLERQRSGRLGALSERFAAKNTSAPNLARAEADLWFKAVASADQAKAVKVLKLAEAYANDCKPGEWSEVRPLLAILPAQTGELLRPEEVVLALNGFGIPGRALVVDALQADVEVKRILIDVMKVKTPDDNVWMSVLSESLQVPGYPAAAESAGWTLFWSRLRAAPPSSQQRFLDHYGKRIRVRRADGLWLSPHASLLPGVLVEREDSVNAKLLVDHFHDSDTALLGSLGVSQFPKGTLGPGTYDEVAGSAGELSEWLEDCRSLYRNTHRNRASWDYLVPKRVTMPAGFAFLPKLSGTANANLTRAFLARMMRGEFMQRLEFGHSTMSSYAPIEVAHPLPWFILRYGTLKIGDSAVRLACVMVRRNAVAALAMVPEWQGVVAVLDKLQEVRPAVSPSDKDLGKFWLAMIQALATPTAVANDSLDSLWSGAAKDGVVPETVGEVSLAEVFVTGSLDLARRVRRLGRMVVTLDKAALDLWKCKGARDLSALVRPEWSKDVAPTELLITAIPDIADVLTSDARNGARCQPVADLKLRVDTASDPLPCLMWENILLLDVDRLASMPRAHRMYSLINEISHASWLDCSVEEALRRLGDARVDELRARVVRGESLAERLLLAVGNRPAPLLEALGSVKDLRLVRECTPLRVAELALALLGPATLPALRDTLEAEGLQPPPRWNTSEARDFVASIGFPESYAASPETRREAEEFINGPIELPALHDFQEEVLQGISTLVAVSRGRRRAVVSLPTGGGKTRVTVEAAVKLVLTPEGPQRSVVWVAQTDELCEQAVQAFRQVWINVGARKTHLRVVRLWGGNPNPVIQELDKPIAIIASIQTLNSRMTSEGLAWLRTPGLVVVDECHHAITPSYTNLLRWLDAEAPRPGTLTKDEPPIIGLSATPFRTDDTESQRLAKRFDNRWLPRDQEGLHVRLVAKGVLAKADYEALESGARLLDEEMNQLARFSDSWEGLDFEKVLLGINQRLAGDENRNQRLVDHIRQSTENSILLFANSVGHAEEMSARLHLGGITAAAVSGDTPTVARRHFLGRFQSGEIRVLCNHSVLTTGFDAPKTDMVLIARQVFSPVRYMQMVGRGLRGEKNGGKPRCRIVTVMDNLGRFQDRHPYHYCKQHFSAMADSPEVAP